MGAHEPTGSARLSIVRAFFDGFYVIQTLKKHGLSRLLTGRSSRVVSESSNVADSEMVNRARQVSQAVDVGLGFVPAAPTCLRRSVTLLRELDRLNIVSVLCIGVRSRASQIEAHAWLTVGAEVVNDDPELTSTYEVLAVGDIERIMSLLK
jgi:Transglutaminase-like superfamily